MAESRLQRWLRQKAETRHQTLPDRPSALSPKPSAEEEELLINESLGEQELLEKYQLPAPDSITLGTDITGFMRQEIPEYLRRKALRALWISNPVLAVRDGLNDYDEDFSAQPAVTQGLQTLYKAGQGYLEQTARAAEHDEEGTEKSSSPAPVEALSDTSHDAVDRSQIELAVDSPANTRPLDPVATDASPALRYRPRMRFE